MTHTESHSPTFAAWIHLHRIKPKPDNAAPDEASGRNLIKLGFTKVIAAPRFMVTFCVKSQVLLLLGSPQTQVFHQQFSVFVVDCCDGWGQKVIDRLSRSFALSSPHQRV